jgi:preprotein translocase subunit SecA
MLADRQLRFDDQIDSRLETLDIFLDGLGYESDEPRNPQEIYKELRELVRVRFELTPDQIKDLAGGGGEDLRDELTSQLTKQVTQIEFKRLIGAVERLLGQPLEAEPALDDLDWSSIQIYLRGLVEDQFNHRLEAFFTNPDDARIRKSIVAGLKEIQVDKMSDHDLVNLLGLMAEGRQAAYDKKSHKRIWIRTQRLRYTFYAADLLYRMDLEEAGQDIINHIDRARVQIQNAWGENELRRLADKPLGDLKGDIYQTMQDVIGKDVCQTHKEQEIGALPGEIKELVMKELGRSAVTNIYRDLFLRVVSELWVEYLTEMEALRVAIGLEAYAQRDPLVQYKNQGFEMFQRLMENMRTGVVNRMFTFQPRDVSRVQAGVKDPT